MKIEWVKQEDGHFITENDSGKFVIDEEGNLLTFIVTPDHSLSSDGYVCISHLIIPEGVKRIGNVNEKAPLCASLINSLFSGYIVNDKIEFPESLEVIGEGEFQHCILPIVEFPQNLTTLGPNVFLGSNMSELILGSNLLCCGNGAFCNCEIDAVIIPKGMKHTDLRDAENCMAIGGRIFKCAQISTLLIPSTPENYSYRRLFTEAHLYRVVRYTDYVTEAEDDCGWNQGEQLIRISDNM